jgi:hypothetical protein
LDKKETHDWDNKWYYMSLPKNSDVLLLLWVEEDKGSHTYAWVVLQRNSNDAWFYTLNNTDWVKIETGIENVHNWATVTSVKISFKAPRLAGDWKKEDIQYRFGQ